MRIAERGGHRVIVGRTRLEFEERAEHTKVVLHPMTHLAKQRLALFGELRRLLLASFSVRDVDHITAESNRLAACHLDRDDVVQPAIRSGLRPETILEYVGLAACAARLAVLARPAAIVRVHVLEPERVVGPLFGSVP